MALTELAEYHWDTINPKTLSGHYKVKESLVGRVVSFKNLYGASQTKGKFDFYAALLDKEFAFLKRIITCPAAELPNVIEQVRELLEHCDLLPEGDMGKEMSDELLYDVFQYHNWRNNGKAKNLFDLQCVDVCPYCNLNYTYVDDVSSKLVFTYDHFYDKGRFPYLSLSFSNLIPSCQPCNLTYKFISDFTVDSHLHPYIDDYNEVCTFFSKYIGISDDDLQVEIRGNDDSRCERYNLDLGIVPRYNIPDMLRNVRTCFQISRDYDSFRKNELLRINGWNNIEEVNRWICKAFNIPFLPSSILETQYGKLRRDLAIQYNLL